MSLKLDLLLKEPCCSQSHFAAASPDRMSLEEMWLVPRRLNVPFTLVCPSPQNVPSATLDVLVQVGTGWVFVVFQSRRR